MKFLKITLMFSLLCSCTHLPRNFEGNRDIASNESCIENMKNFLEDDSTQAGLNIALAERKLISYSDKLITINYPRLDWINETKHNLMNRIKNWNKNEYPIFYMDAQEKYTAQAEVFSTLLEKELLGTIDDNEKQTLSTIRSWIENFKNYQTDLDNLLDERISYQFNIIMLKDVHLEKNEARDIKLTFKINGETKNEILTLRTQDRNKQFYIDQYQQKIKELDGKLGHLGKIEERVIQQAILYDAVTIIQRKLEYHVKNTENIAPELVQQLNELNLLLADKASEPSTYGVYKISNQVFKAELANLFTSNKMSEDVKTKSALDVHHFISSFFGRKKPEPTPISSPINSTPATNMASVVNEAANTAPAIANVVIDAANEAIKNKHGIVSDVTNPLKKIYAKIATFTPYQKFTATVKMSVIGYGTYRYFYFKQESPATDVTGMTSPTPTNGNTPAPTNGSMASPVNGVISHQTQAANTASVEDAKSQGHSSVIELQIAKLKKQFNY